MSFSQDLAVFGTKAGLVAFATSFVIKRFGSETLPAFLVLHAFAVSLALVFLFGVIDQTFIYPFYRSPLRKLPTFKDYQYGQTITESPRGKTALTWMKQFPDAEMIRILGPFNVPMVVLCGAHSLRDVLNTHPYDFEKFQGIAAFLSRIIGYGLILSEGNPHRVQRKALVPSFQIRKIRDLYGLMWQKTGILLDELQKDIDQHRVAADSRFGKVEMAEWSSRLTLDIIGPVAMGKDFQSLTNKENAIAAAYLEILDPSTARLIFLALHLIMPEWIIRRLPWSVNRMIDTNCSFLRDVSRKIVLEKRSEVYGKGEPAKYDILSSIIQTGQFNDDQIIDQMLTFLAAGHETTASALAWACYLCSKHPEIQSKLRAEIRANITSSTSSVTYDVLESMPYLNGVCEETQRLYPTVPATVREPIIDTVIDGVPVPKGTRLLLIPHAINRHPKFWGETGSDFVPERWIDTLEDGTLRPNKHGGATTNYAEITFLHGPRSCLGRDFAKAELRCAVAGIIGKFQVELQNPSVEPKVRGVVTTKPDGGMHLIMKPVGGW